MSVICIARKNGVSAISADSQTSCGYQRRHAKYQAKASKIIPVGENLLGIVGYCAHQIVLTDLAKTQLEMFDLSDSTRIFKTLGKLHKILKKKYHLKTSEYGSQPYESSQMNFCIANAAGIYEVDSYREVFQVERFWAIGSGAHYALGAMHGCYDRDGISAREIVEIGVRAAVEFDLFCGKPIETHAVKKRRKKASKSA